MLALNRIFLSACTLVAAVVLAVAWDATSPARADEPVNGPAAPTAADAAIDFNRDVRPILTNNCFTCHGFDAKERKADLRLDTREGATADLGGHAAVVPGDPSASELVARITAADPDDVMPPVKTGKKLSPREVDVLTRWVKEGAPYARHWAYVKPQRSVLPQVQNKSWPRNGVDHFVLARLEKEGLTPSPEADKYALVRRVTLDITGLPPTLEEVDAFVNDPSPDAYEKLVDRLLNSPHYGEHWARMWLDLARYADSSGYADDPPRQIWAYRDWVIRALNANMPFDQFTIEQLAGDLLPDVTEDRLIATAFHRNTQTNNEGGTNDEEYRTVAVVDRVNTTMAVWMGTTMACAQCHDHKYDPITQEEYFRLYAILNNTQDADRGDEAPTLAIYTEEQKSQKQRLDAEAGELEKVLSTATPELLAKQAQWEAAFPRDLKWEGAKPQAAVSAAGLTTAVQEDGTVLVAPRQGIAGDTYTVELPLGLGQVSAVQLRAVQHDSLPNKGPGHAGGNFVVTRVRASIVPPQSSPPSGRFVRLELPGSQRTLHVAEVQVLSGGQNVALKGKASQSSVDYDGQPERAIDGNTNGDYFAANSVTHNKVEDNPWWEVDLGSTLPLDQVVVWNRTDNNLQSRLDGFRVIVLDENRQVVAQADDNRAPQASAPVNIGGPLAVDFGVAVADVTQDGFDAATVLDDAAGKAKGWAVGGPKAATLTLVAKQPVTVPPGSKLSVVIEQQSKHAGHTLGAFRIAATDSAGAAEWVRTPAEVTAALTTAAGQRTDAQRQALTSYFLRNVAADLQPQRQRLAELQMQLAQIKPATVPILRELDGAMRRKTNIQLRGNFLDLGAEVTEGLPLTFHPAPQGQPLNRLALARWLVDENNPLTARVTVNRYWERFFGVGLVGTSEEFGSQGDLPTNPELLDWLATELVANKWDLKYLVKLLVTSSAYRQSSKVTPELIERDPDNRLLARGPRFRLTAESVRDQALFVGGLLSRKMYGPPVRPPQPVLGVSAAFGGGIDWTTSEGEDKYRRGLYITWRRSNPYPSMAAFDAPNREVCVLNRPRTNTPLQALVTMNDPVYMEAAQALARRMVREGGATNEQRATYGFRLCLARLPAAAELSRLVALHGQAYERFKQNPDQAAQIATNPIGPAPEGSDVADLAAWTLVGNVLLNLDEIFMSR